MPAIEEPPSKPRLWKGGSDQDEVRPEAGNAAYVEHDEGRLSPDERLSDRRAAPLSRAGCNVISADSCLRKPAHPLLRCRNSSLLLGARTTISGGKMEKAESVSEDQGRLPIRFRAALEPELQDALNSPVRREVLRALERPDRSVSIGELVAELRPYTGSQLGYHLRVLRLTGAIATRHEAAPAQYGSARYASSLTGEAPVRAVLRATERNDREQREATAAANASPLLTMFRVPRPVRTIRLRSRREADAEGER
jgi:DNA-binding transcriptional ArsR family regulator